MSRLSPLHNIHIELGGMFTDFAGWRMPVRYGSELAEHHAVRQAAGLFDLSHMGQIEVIGPEAGCVLDFALVGNLSELQVGRARYTMLCHPAGGVLDDLVVYRLAEQRYLVVANAANVTIVTVELTNRGGGFAATVADRSTDYALIAIQGPAAANILADLTEADLSALRYYASAPIVIKGHELLLARTGYTGEDGFELFCSPDEAGPLWRILTAAGAPHGLIQAGLACRDTLRLEAGMPLHGHELHVGVTPFDAGLGRVVKFDKCVDFIGRASLQVAADAPGEKRLVGLVGQGRRASRVGYPVLAGDTEVGVITSGALSPTLGVPIALAYVTTGCTQPGTVLTVDVRGRREPVEVVPLPFYTRSR